MNGAPDAELAPLSRGAAFDKIVTALRQQCGVAAQSATP